MTTKLTISMDKDIIERSKQYAAQHGRSLSDLIETYLQSLHSPGGEVIQITPKVSSLRGSFKSPPELDYKAELEKAILRKHG